jgi:DNA polymerase III epsilon subunit family exonuclease
VPLAPAPPLRRALDRLAASEEAIPLSELARRLLALREPPPLALARRLVASALDCAGDRLPDTLHVQELPRLVEGPAAELPLERTPWVVVDLETTGLCAERSTILEIGAVRVVGLGLAERFHALVDPGVPIPPRITRLTGIDRSMLDGAPPLAAAVHAFRAWVGDEPGVAFVAHNAGFDARFLARAFAAHGLAPWPGPVLCTRRLARRLLPDLARYDLDTLAARFGIANRWRHRALGDAGATARALLELVALAREAAGLRTLGDLLARQARAAPRRPGRRRRSRRAGGGVRVSPG